MNFGITSFCLLLSSLISCSGSNEGGNESKIECSNYFSFQKDTLKDFVLNLKEEELKQLYFADSSKNLKKETLEFYRILSIAMFTSELKNNEEAYGKFISDLNSYLMKNIVENNDEEEDLKEIVDNVFFDMLLESFESILYNEPDHLKTPENFSRVCEEDRIEIISHEAVGDFIHQDDSCEIPEEFSNIFEDYKEALLKKLSDSERVKFENKKLSEEAINKLVDVLIYIVKDLFFESIMEANALNSSSQEAKDINVCG